jgi:hypothetical protein
MEDRGPVRDPRYTNPPRPMMPNPMRQIFVRRPLRERLMFWRKPAAK